MLRLQAPLPDTFTTSSPAELEARIADAKRALAGRLLILGHHYQRDEVIRWADARGDSLKLARYAAECAWASDIVFCGVHFMAESADVLTGPDQRVILPDLNAGCSMADMADVDEVEECWDALAEVIDVDAVVPITYVNSSAAVKAFVGRHGGACCTSSNAREVLAWALGRPGARGARDPERRVLFVPDQHLGRNTAFDMGFSGSEMRVWNPRLDLGGLEERDVKEARFLLWKGHCSVHQRFRVEHVEAARAAHPGVRVVVHPECSHEVVELADFVGSTERILAEVERAPAGSTLAIGTEIHMVNRMAAAHPDKTVFSLDPLICPCSTMFRIDEPHLAWCLEALVRGEEVNRITVDADTVEWARVALSRMLELG
ncbi:MAG: quinolinate synthase NadA [Acidimicrobiia bacterium]